MESHTACYLRCLCYVDCEHHAPCTSLSPLCESMARAVSERLEGFPTNEESDGSAFLLYAFCTNIIVKLVCNPYGNTETFRL